MVAVSSVNSSEMKVSDSPICSRIQLSVQSVGTAHCCFLLDQALEDSGQALYV